MSVVAVAVSVAVAAVVGGARAGTGDFCYNCSDVSTAAELSAPETPKLPAQVSGLRDGSSQEFRLRTSSGYRRIPRIKKFAQPCQVSFKVARGVARTLGLGLWFSRSRNTVAVRVLGSRVYRVWGL